MMPDAHEESKVVKVGLIGVGVMGEPMAGNLAKAGMALTIFNRTAAKCDALRATGVAVADTAAHVIEASDAVILMVPDGREVDAILGRDGAGKITVEIAGKLIILMSTVAPSYSAKLAADIHAAGGSYVEAPVSGSRKPAENGELLVLAAAQDAGLIDRAQPLFDAVGKKTIRCGAVPNAMRMKLASNLLLAAHFEALAEATHFARGIGLDVDQFLAMVQAGPLANSVLAAKATKLLADDFTPQASIRHVAKDVGLICEEASDHGLRLPVTATNRELYLAAASAGLANEDAIAIIKVFRDRP